MSSTTNLSEIGCFQIEGHHIPLTISNQINCDYYFVSIKAPELYGILRRSVEGSAQIDVYQKSGFYYLQVVYNVLRFSTILREFFCISESEMDMFLYYYCGMKRKEKINWKEFGF